jgi:hypothetical protein
MIKRFARGTFPNSTINFSEITLSAQRTDFYGKSTQRTLVCPGVVTHTNLALGFNGAIKSIVLPLKAESEKRLTKTQIASRYT